MINSLSWIRVWKPQFIANFFSFDIEMLNILFQFDFKSKLHTSKLIANWKNIFPLIIFTWITSFNRKRFQKAYNKSMKYFKMRGSVTVQHASDLCCYALFFYWDSLTIRRHKDNLKSLIITYRDIFSYFLCICLRMTFQAPNGKSNQL